MTGSKVDHLEQLSEEDKTAIKEALKTWKDSGVENPHIPINVDVDGDGLVDSYYLNDSGELAVKSGESILETVYRSEGESDD